MEVVERKRPRGAFLNLFDWPGKSRKKLFSSNVSQISEESKQSKDNVVQNPPITRHSVFEVDQSVKSLPYNPRSDSSCCASSVTSDDGNVARAPSVVARLMGLECLPLQNVAEARGVNADLDPYFLRSSRQAATWDVNVDQQSEYDGVSWDHLDSRTNKGPRKRMIERFQTETLPPRSAKPISVTHNKLLSPIRNPGFVPSRNPAYVMEAASRMIEPSPRMMARTRVVSASDCPSPVPLRIRDLKERLEAAQKTSVPQVSSDNTRNNKYLNEKKSTASGKSSCEVKPPPFSAQAKTSSTNQKQESLTTTSSGNKRIHSGQKEKTEAKNRAVKSQNGAKGSSLSTGKNVLKQNHQKQNYQKQNSRDNQQSRKVMNKVVNKVLVDTGSTSKSPSFTMSSAEKSTSSSRKKSLPRSKKPRNGVQESGIYEDKRVKRGDKSIKCNISIDGDSSTSKDDQKRDMDVISFTFSSSIKGLSPYSQGIKQDADSAVKCNVIGGDSLNALLEQKLRELASKIESPSSSLIQEECLSSISKDRADGMISSPSNHGEMTDNSINKVLTESETVSDCSSLYNNQKFQKKNIIQAEEYEVNSISTLTGTDNFSLSCSKSLSDYRHNREYGMKRSSSDQELTWVSSNESHQTIDETESTATHDWELEYITKILNSGQLMFQDFALGTSTEELLPSSLFDELERSRGAATAMRIERKALFDCVNQCLAVKCERMLNGSCKGMILLEHRDLLAKEVNREVKGLKKMGEMMIDELVDHDMSCFEGRWIDFEKEMFEEGVEFEEEIVSALLDDLVSDLLS